MATTNQFLVFTGRIPEIVTPATTVTTNRDGSKQFWYWKNGQSIKAILPYNRNAWRWKAQLPVTKRGNVRYAA